MDLNATSTSMVDEINELEKRGFSIDPKTGGIIGFNANFFVEYVKERINILYSTDEFYYIYNDGVWVKKNDKEVLQLLRDMLQEPRFGIWKSRMEEEYTLALKREVFFSGELNPYKNIINMKNGVYDLKTQEFLPHNPKYLSTIQIPVEYKEQADWERFRRYLEEIFEKDYERIALAQEWFGYAITTETKAQKALILHGSGGNGKGVFTEVLSMLIGDDNISHIPLNELHKGFSRVCLYNKTANICNENETDGKSFNTQYFKAIVGEDTINAEQKNKPVFSFKPTVKFILSMNSLSSTKDKSKGYFRRLMILNFTAYFSEASRDKDLKDKLKDELPGIFLWAVDGLKRLEANDFKFSKCKNMEKSLKKYEKEQNPLIAFFEDCIVTTDDLSYREDNRVIINTFKNWAETNGHKGYASMSSQRFWKEFEAIALSKGYNCEAGRSNALRYHKGVKVEGEYKAALITRPRSIFRETIEEQMAEL